MGTHALAWSGFTLIELLVVLSVIAVLAGLLLPTGGVVRRAALKARTRSQFAQWAMAVEQFKADYGYYPRLATVEGRLDPSRFFAALTGRDFRGGLLSGAALNGNIRGATYYTISPAEGVRGADGSLREELMDAFGNSQIAVLVDSDGDGWLRGSELRAVELASGNSREGFGAVQRPSASVMPADQPVPFGVAFYTVGAGLSGEDWVFSWK